ncbi:MAG: hypothetical protein A3F82_08525 [Deltaproteobacteria bacterium RIFCSPLOWO2_12_FULL_44_12]|nr:MAG: hypothetical protein A2712_00400 [Deltaproteobacteria bacterium RIFCSPHIGHO2_01_FULL_43_49]OGQ15877.1 MAG: hypothetical protein A3D22_03050 [Deltaproteobacteria bacterium RIFCSPHIGHO2_02_FULL_44_53]OGQ28831.1 MAG: hypothetical protein A3D98_01380 [Deltaproteobacteria bacterium RIFCSPHIGHO2_12_FULL_44_21]OGQ32151.1 MAG: hypothetical protein A2979_03505 [Deltaproteobacteria bacterium RIFCSPLOWO2_01_FULL_45_74]OGQ43706.1 MAG: hypothetical protein A3I70_05485 [Deltaproteobacteria bacterium 
MSSLAEQHSQPEAIAIEVCFTDDMICLTLLDGREVRAPLELYPKLAQASPEQRMNYRLIGGGRGIHWEALDEDLSVESIVLGRKAN